MIPNLPPLSGPMMPPNMLPVMAAEDTPVAPELPQQKSNLKLTDDQLKELIRRAEQRMAEVRREMGLDVSGNVEPGSWMAIRERNSKSYLNDFSWREELEGSIFAQGSNLSLGDNDRYVRLLSAANRDNLLGTRPCFSAMSGRDKNSALTKQVEEYVQDRVDTSNVMPALREAIRVALAINEAVLKTTYKLDATPYIGPAKGVFVDALGAPVRTPSKGLLVFKNDDVIPDPNTEGLVRLKKDPSFAFYDSQYEMADFESLQQTQVHYDNAYTETLDYRDFLCPLKERATHEADINVHLYEKSPEWVYGTYSAFESSRNWCSQYGAETGFKRPDRVAGEMDEESSNVSPKVLIAEIYMRCDPDGDGQGEKEIMLVLDVHAHEAVFYDYTANHMNRRPFAPIIGVEKHPKRWYGIGVYTKMEHSGLFVDATYSRINEKQSKSASATFRYKQAVTQWKNGEPCILGTTRIYDIDSSWDPSKPPIFRINLQENAQLDTEMMGLARQAADQKFGVISGRDASASDLNQSRTATGVMSVERDANIIRKDQETDMSEGIEAVLWQVVDMLLENMDEEVLMFSPDGSELVKLNREEIRSLDRQVRLLLTKSRTAEGLQNITQAEALQDRYLADNPYNQHYKRDLALRALKLLDIDNADELLPEVTLDEAKAWMAAQAQKQEPPKPPSKNISTKYGELARSEQRQILSQEGIQPASDEELQQGEAEDLAREIKLKKTAPPNGNPTSKPAGARATSSGARGS